MKPDFFVAILPELIRLGAQLAKRHKGDHSAAIREIRALGDEFLERDAVARAELEKMRGR